MRQTTHKTARRIRYLQEKLRTVSFLLETTYGPPPPQRRRRPLDVLIMTILSQNTNDRNSERAYRAMRKAFPTWEAVMNAPQRRLVRLLKPGGLAATKSRRIRRLLRSIAAQGELMLGNLRRLSTEEVESRLLSFDGVGYKTARCVLLFALGRDVFPIDTHIFRVLRRLDVIPEGMSVEKAHQYLPARVPPGRSYALHLHLIAHGRQICHPRKPECAACVLRRLCPHGRRREQPGV